MRAYVVSSGTFKRPSPEWFCAWTSPPREARQEQDETSFVHGAALEQHRTHMGLCNLHDAASAFGLISKIYAHKVMIE